MVTLGASTDTAPSTSLTSREDRKTSTTVLASGWGPHAVRPETAASRASKPARRRARTSVRQRTACCRDSSSTALAAGYDCGVSGGKERFARLMQEPEERLDLGLAALLIAQEEYPDLDVDRWLRELDELGRQARDRVQPGMPAAEAVQALGGLLGGELGFRGNEDEYYDPRNSFLNDVLERRTGIPISLAAVYIEVGRRAGADVRGVGFPAHFLARCEDVIFDPFNGGRIVTEDDCRELLL